MYDASDRKQVRKAEKEARQSELVRADIVKGLMSQPLGRAYVYDRLATSHIFNSSFSTEPLRMAFSEGERNIGLQLLADLLAFCPHQFTLMLQERNAEDGRRRSDNDRDNDGLGGGDANGDGRDSFATSADAEGLDPYAEPAA